MVTELEPETVTYLKSTMANISAIYLSECSTVDCTDGVSWQTVTGAIVCTVIVLATLAGNLLVCFAVMLVRKLQTPSNFLIVSLAIADMLVGALVMPPALVYEIADRWPLSLAICDAWTSLDVLLCTASILNLCMISIDRYLVITRPFDYAPRRTPSRMAAMVVTVWIVSGVISIPPLFEWKAIKDGGHCMLNQSIVYQIYATIGAFYLPLAIMVFIYYRIYLVSRRIANSEATERNSRRPSPDASRRPMPSPPDSSALLMNHQIKDNGFLRPPEVGLYYKLRVLKQPKHRCPPLNSSMKDHKATKTLGIIMGAFTVCWLPFFLLAVLRLFCEHPEFCIPDWLNGFFLWLGYANSALNPIVYARFNRDFRTPFKQILSCSCRSIDSRLRSETYAEQYGAADFCSSQDVRRGRSCSADSRYQNSLATDVIKLNIIISADKNSTRDDSLHSSYGCD